MNKKYFEENVIMAVEVEYEDGGRCWREVKGSNMGAFLDALDKDEERFLSDIDYCTKQADPAIAEVLEKAYKAFDESRGTGKFKNIREAIDMFLEDDKPKRVWTEDEIRHLIQTNDVVLYRALRKMYAQQTADEQEDGNTKYHNGVGFNGADAKIMSGFAQFLARTGFLTPKQRAVARKKLAKYNRQLTRLANA